MLNYAKDQGAYPLYRAHKLDAGYDLSASETKLCEPGAVTLINTGIHIGILPWQMAFVQPRSSTAKLGLLVITGVIDAGYTGAIKLQILNFSDKPVLVNAGQRLAQLVVHNNASYSDDLHLMSLDDLIDNQKLDNRGNNGFGSSGS